MIDLTSGKREALFYAGVYFLLPEGYHDASDLLVKLRRMEMPVTLSVAQLQEQYDVPDATYEQGVCMAPYFITDYMDGETELEIVDAEQVYPVQVELLTQKEYNDRLREQVTKHCPGCRGFGSVNEHDDSLSGHFSEISLNGVCMLRWESGRGPVYFKDGLDSLLEVWEPWGYSKAKAEHMCLNLRDELHLTFDRAELTEENGERTLHLWARKNDFFQTKLTEAAASHLNILADPAYHLLLHDEAALDFEDVEALLGPRKIKATRKLMKKYGVAIGVLSFAPAAESRVLDVLGMMTDNRLVWPLFRAPGQLTVLLLHKAQALMMLRYVTPALEGCYTQIVVFDAERTARYTVNFDMPCEVLDIAAAKAEKPVRPSRRVLKAEKQYVLSRAKAEELFIYLNAQMGAVGCDNTLRFTRTWLERNLPEAEAQRALNEILDMGGGCDCEVLMNCYQDYEIDE